MNSKEPTKSAKENRQSAGSGRVDRLSDQTRGLMEDVKEWIDLRIQLIQVDLEDRIERIANELLSAVVVFVLLFLIIVFLLVGLALGLGPVLGHPAWGFVSVAGILVVMALIIHFIKPRFIKGPNLRPRSALPEGTKQGIAGVLSESTDPDTHRSSDANTEEITDDHGEA